MISTPFTFHPARDIEGALQLLAGYGTEATVLAGGMSLVPAMNLGLVRSTVIVSLNRVRELDYIREDSESVRLGAMVRHARIATDPVVRRYCPALSDAARCIGDVQVRHRGSLGGSVAHADPAADYLPVLVASGARVLLKSTRGERRMSIDEFMVDVMATRREPDELLAEIEVPKPGAGAGSAYLRFARVEGSFPLVNAAAIVAPRLRADGLRVRVAIGGVGAKPVVVELSQETLGPVSERTLETVGEAAYAATKNAHSDIVADRAYRRALARVFATRATRAAANHAG